jgi:hypothetical protein
VAFSVGCSTRGLWRRTWSKSWPGGAKT